MLAAGSDLEAYPARETDILARIEGGPYRIAPSTPEYFSPQINGSICDQQGYFWGSGQIGLGRARPPNVSTRSACMHELIRPSTTDSLGHGSSD
jgi:hypothetical protein